MIPVNSSNPNITKNQEVYEDLHFVNYSQFAIFSATKHQEGEKNAKTKINSVLQ